MWEAIKSILTSQYTYQVLIVLTLIVCTISILLKAGLITVRTKHVQIGDAREEEHTIMHKQKEYAHATCTAMLNTILSMDSTLDTWRTKCVLEYVYDEILDWITFNHITTDNDYVAVKAASLRAIVRSNVEKDIFFTDEFNHVIDTFTRNTITELIRIRKVVQEQRR